MPIEREIKIDIDKPDCSCERSIRENGFLLDASKLTDDKFHLK